MKATCVWASLFLVLVTLGSTGCNAPGRPKPGPEVPRPDKIVDFTTLYKQNCAACHGENGQNGVDVDLNNPVYLALVGETNLRQIVANGIPGKLSPAFAQSAGGMLTDQQVDSLVQGIYSAWSKPGILDGKNAPPYTTTLKGDAQKGHETFNTYCASCHGVDGKGNAKVGPIADPTYLALVSDQLLRTTMIAGRPDLKMPDWQEHQNHPAMTDQDVTDVVAWLSSQRVQFPGQQYSETKK
ncbi:MAG: c-type cytochrome [Acidobacteriaceae bacterium]